MNSNFFDQIDRLCIFCNLSQCTCFSSSKKHKVYERIVQIPTLKRKWVTRIDGSFTEEQFISFKHKLGTGGKYFKDHLLLRGKLCTRLKELLESLNYKLLPKAT